MPSYDRRVVALLAAAAIALPGFHVYGAPPGGGTLLQGVFPGGARRSFVFLPPGFTRTQRYPVLYLLHGMPGDPSEYTNSLGLARWSDPQITSGALRPFIGVVPAAGPYPQYDGEWAGPWEDYIVHDVVPWVDAHLPTIASARGRVLAGLSAGGYGAYDIGLRHPELFGRLASWSGYFHPLHDGPFKHADKATLAANDPWLILHADAPRFRRDGVRFFLSTGPRHSHWEKPSETLDFGRALSAAGLPATVLRFRSSRGHWGFEFHAGLRWAFGLL